MLNLNPTTIVADRIITREAELDPEEMEAAVRRLMQRGQITERDESLLEALRELNVLSLGQIARLFWHGSPTKAKTIYERMRKLNNAGLISSPRTPRREMQAWGLEPGKVYALGSLGRYWLGSEVNDKYVPPYLKRDQIVHDLLVAEWYLRALETTLQRGPAWSLQWVGENGASYYKERHQPPIIAPDGLGVLVQRRAGGQAMLPFFVEFDAGREAHGRYSHDWGRKVVGYDRFAGSEWRMHPALSNLPDFPAVLVITHGAERIQNLARSIAEKRKKPLVYYLALWPDVLAAEDVFAAPVWMAIAPDGRIVGREPQERVALVSLEPDEETEQAAQG